MVHSYHITARCSHRAGVNKNRASPHKAARSAHNAASARYYDLDRFALISTVWSTTSLCFEFASRLLVKDVCTV